MSDGTTGPTADEILGMSDEDILNMVAAPTGEEAEPEPVEPPVEEPAPVEEAATEEPAPVEEPVAGEEGKADDAGGEPAAEAKPDQGQEPEVKDPVGSKTEDKAPDYQGFYEKIMAPFQANGKQIKLRDPDEAIKLMQMGANYTRKLQDIAPHRKVLMMLQNNDLLDETKLSYLIDLDKKNPEAIKKLVKDSGIDPLDIDVQTEPTYQVGNHAVSDAEAGFRNTLEDLTSTPEGFNTVQKINSDLDDASKEALWQSPEIMSILHQQRQAGIYDLIVEEMDRQKILGTIPPTTPFLQAYKQVGDELASAGRFPAEVAEQPGAKPTDTPTGEPGPEVVATRVAAPKSQVENGDKASAAATPRSTPRKAETVVNPLAMSDEEFANLSQFNGRL